MLNYLGPSLLRAIYLLCAVISAIVAMTAVAQALPVVDQTGNLAINGNFESGTTTLTTSGFGVGAASAFTSWRQYANSSPSVSTQLTNTPLLEGNSTARILGNFNNGIYQYAVRAPDDYTLSAWVYVVSGSAHLGLAWNGGSNEAYSPASTLFNTWQYLIFTTAVPSSLGGPLVYTASDGTDFYVDGLWYNASSSSLSPFDPSTGFNPNPATVPEPSTLLMLSTGALNLLGFGWLQQQGRKQRK